MPFKMSPKDFRACQFESTFSENFGCLYYSHIWSDVRGSFENHPYFSFKKKDLFFSIDASSRSI